jgi:hypothetical protein
MIETKQEAIITDLNNTSIVPPIQHYIIAGLLNVKIIAFQNK